MLLDPKAKVHGDNLATLDSSDGHVDFINILSVVSLFPLSLIPMESYHLH